MNVEPIAVDLSLALAMLARGACEAALERSEQAELRDRRESAARARETRRRNARARAERLHALEAAYGRVLADEHDSDVVLRDFPIAEQRDRFYPTPAALKNDALALRQMHAQAAAALGAARGRFLRRRLAGGDGFSWGPY